MKAITMLTKAPAASSQTTFGTARSTPPFRPLSPVPPRTVAPHSQFLLETDYGSLVELRSTVFPTAPEEARWSGAAARTTPTARSPRPSTCWGTAGRC
ncbi:hypothetical protein GCM10010430_33680 [Kitasatospora cystarginea]|uniref:Uncharacterized protein n=1 Tax=Kitasatospora cystarginea TaxID=58350 RepID=A0ABN3E4L4_9ACTN